MIIGLLAGMGIVLTLSVFVRPRPTLAERVLPYRDHGRPQPRMIGRAVRLGVKAVERIGSTTASVERRLRTLGDQSLRDFRMSQLQWAGVGFAAGLACSFALVARSGNLILALALALGGGIGGALAADSDLTRRATKHSRALTAQLPDAAELMSLAVSAGEPMQAALERVGAIGTGELAGQIDRTLREIRAGASMDDALLAMGERSQSSQVGRFCDALVTASQRGTPIAEVLSAQVQDARDQARRELLEIGGKREISMMIPVVFLILPVTVVFTLYPGLYALTLMT